MTLLKEIAKEEDLMVCIATHSKLVREMADCIYEISNREIKCIKSGDTDGMENVVLPEKKSHFSIWQYVLTYYQKFKMSKGILTLLCSLAIATYILSTSVSTQIIAKQKEMLSTLINTEILVTKNLSGKFYAPDVEAFDAEVYERIIHLEHVKGYVPIVALQTTILDQKVDVLPYSELMNLAEFQTSGEVYISFDLALLLNAENYPYPLSVDLSLLATSGLVSEDLAVTSSLKSVYHNRYSANDLVIYLDEQRFYELYEAIAGSAEFVPNTVLVYADSYAQVQQLRQTISAILGMGQVDNEYVDMTSLNESTEAFTTYLRLISISLVVIVWLMLIIIYSRYMINREYEFCILKSNGITKDGIQKLMLADILVQSILFTVTSFIIVVVVCEILKGLHIIGAIAYLHLLIPTLLVSCGSLIVPTLIALKKVNQFSPARFLRR